MFMQENKFFSHTIQDTLYEMILIKNKVIVEWLPTGCQGNSFTNNIFTKDLFEIMQR